MNITENKNDLISLAAECVPEGCEVLLLTSGEPVDLCALNDKGCKITVISDIAELEEPEKILIEKQYDVVVFDDVFTKLKRPADLLNYVEGFLKDNACILASIFNFTYGLCRMKALLGTFDYKNMGALSRSELNFFDYDRLTSFFGEEGYYINRLYRVTKPIDDAAISATLKSAGFKATYAEIDNLRRMREFEVERYLIRACPAKDKPALKELTKGIQKNLSTIRTLKHPY